MSLPSDQISPLTGDVGAVPDGILSDACVVVEAAAIILVPYIVNRPSNVNRINDVVDVDDAAAYRQSKKDAPSVVEWYVENSEAVRAELPYVARVINVAVLPVAVGTVTP